MGDAIQAQGEASTAKHKLELMRKNRDRLQRDLDKARREIEEERSKRAWDEEAIRAANLTGWWIIGWRSMKARFGSSNLDGEIKVK
ncbi:hypothetical protein Dimus_003939, partial [Dionaea muscipula]